MVKSTNVEMFLKVVFLLLKLLQWVCYLNRGGGGVLVMINTDCLTDVTGAFKLISAAWRVWSEELRL